MRHPERAGPPRLEPGEELAVARRQKAYPPQSDVAGIGETLRKLNKGFFIHAGMNEGNITLMQGVYHSTNFNAISGRSTGLRPAGEGFIPCFVDDILREIDLALARLGLSARAASIRSGSSPETIRDMRRGHVPSVSRLRALCDALGLEFYVGRPRRPQAGDGPGLTAVPLAALERMAQDLARLAADAGGNPVPDDLRPVPAGRGAAAVVAGREEARFRHDWLERLGIDAAQCAMIRVQGDAMEPTLPEGSLVLVDRARTEWRPPGIFALRTGDGPIFRRAVRPDGERRLMAGDRAGRPAVPLPPDAEILGRARWVAQALD